MDILISYFSDESLTYIMWFLPIFLGVVAYYPVWHSERALKKYNDILKKTPQKDKKRIPLFVSQPYPNIWKFIFVLFLILGFVGFVKYKKDKSNSLQKNSLKSQLDDLKTILNNRDSLYNRRIHLLFKRDSAAYKEQVYQDSTLLAKMYSVLEENHIYFDENMKPYKSGLTIIGSNIYGAKRDNIHYETNVYQVPYPKQPRKK